MIRRYAIKNNGIGDKKPFLWSLTETDATMTGCLAPVTLTADDRTQIYLGASNKLHYPTKDVTIGSCRAYFQLLNGLNAPTSTTAARTIVMDFGDGETTRIANTEDDSSPFSLDSSLDEWFSLDGRPLDGYPAQRSAEGRLFPQGLKKGIYINKGKRNLWRTIQLIRRSLWHCKPDLFFA